MNLQGRLLQAIMHKRAYEEKQPISATFELTPRCGFNCRMCYVHLPDNKVHGELSGEQWLHIAKQAQQMGVLSLCITGGDPLFHKDFKEIWTGISQMGFQITLQTTGAYLTNDILELFEEYPPQMVKITLYGSNNEVYQKVCCIQNGFTNTDKGIQALKALHIPIQLVTTFIKQNYEDRDNIVNYVKENNLPWYYSTACYPSLRGAHSQAKQCALSVYDLGCAEHTAKLWNEVGNKQVDRKPCEMCSGYRTEFIISWDGDIRFCTLINDPHISVINQDLQECWKQLLDYWESQRWPSDCYTCEVKDKCIRCLAHLACQSGGLNKLDKSYCEKVKKMLKETEKENK